MSVLKHSRLSRVLCLLAVSLLPVIALAQTPTGQISGDVVDASGATLPGVTVTALGTATGLSRSTVTNADGHYVLPLLPSGVYDLSAELAGFQPFRRRNVVISVGSDVTVRVPM